MKFNDPKEEIDFHERRIRAANQRMVRRQAAGPTGKKAHKFQEPYEEQDRKTILASARRLRELGVRRGVKKT